MELLYWVSSFNRNGAVVINGLGRCYQGSHGFPFRANRSVILSVLVVEPTIIGPDRDCHFNTACTIHVYTCVDIFFIFSLQVNTLFWRLVGIDNDL